jgi:hypothetical protein
MIIGRRAPGASRPWGTKATCDIKVIWSMNAVSLQETCLYHRKDYEEINRDKHFTSVNDDTYGRMFAPHLDNLKKLCVYWWGQPGVRGNSDSTSET